MEKTYDLELETELEDGQTDVFTTSLRYKLPRGLLALTSALVLGVFVVWMFAQQPNRQVMATADGSGIIDKQEVKVTVFISSISSNMETKKHQQKIHMILRGKRIDFEEVDISTSPEAKEKMRELADDPKALPPQISNGDQYCGDYFSFEAAVEEEDLTGFLKLQ